MKVGKIGNVGVFSNPNSQKNKRGLAPLIETLGGRPEVSHVVLEDMTAISDHVKNFARDGVGLIVINGGDGTVQAVLTALFNAGCYRKPPILAVLPQGNTNMIAEDVGLSGRPGPALARLFDRAEAGDLDRFAQNRHVLRISNGDNSAPHYGMFFGTAGIYRGILACRKNVHSAGFTSSLATGLTLAGLLARSVLGSRRERGFYRGDDITVSFDGGKGQSASYFILLVTTLNRLILKSRPFWGHGKGALRFTGIAFPPPRLARHVLPVLYGGPNRRLPQPGYTSANANTISLTMSDPFTLDGELFEATPDRPVVLEGGGPVRFINL